MPREIQLKIRELLTERKMKQAQLAKRIGVSKGVMAGYCENSWTVLDRTALERLTDALGCEPGSLLTSRESPFFDSFRKDTAPTCVYLRRSDAERIEAGRPVGQRDYRAIDHVIKLLEDAVVGIVSAEDSVTTASEFEERLRNNCVVLGSPWVNKAAELALCRVFGSPPFDPSQIHLVPFHFRVAASPEALPPSSLIASSLIQSPPNQKPGIWLRDEKELLETSAWPREQFYMTDVKKAHDCGVVVVCNHIGPNEKVRKLIVVGGFRGVGTEAAAMALAENFRDLEPGDGESHVWGAIEVYYDKPANSIHREIRSYKWRYRVGGRCPVPFTFRKPLV